MKIAITFTYTAQRASQEVTDKLNLPLGMIEVLDSDGDRYAFVKTEQEALDAIRKLFDETVGGEFDMVETN